MSILHKAVNTTAFLKAGILGFAGSGKTYTASILAIGLAKDIGDSKPVAFFDTETGSDFLIRKFEKEGVELLVAKTRAFKDLLAFMREAQETCSVAIIDSISHVWIELLQAFQRKHNVSRLQFQHWGPIKEEWRQFTDLYVNSPMHVVLCGRAAWEYDFEEDETGKKELIKTGTKMRAETEMGYEPSLLFEMTREHKEGGGKGWINRCTILKDRTDTMNGAVIDYPTYESFRPIVSFLNIGGQHIGVDTTSNSESLFGDPAQSWAERRRQKDILLEDVKNTFVKAGLDGTAAETKRKRLDVLEHAFGTNNWTRIAEEYTLGQITQGLSRLLHHLGLLVAEAPADEGSNLADTSASESDMAPEPPLPPDAVILISKAQHVRLMAMEKECGVSHALLKRLVACYEIDGRPILSTKNIPAKWYEEICSIVQAGPEIVQKNIDAYSAVEAAASDSQA